MRRRLRHVIPLAGFAVLTLGWMWPVLREPGTTIAGAGAGDNLAFLWNTWSMDRAMDARQWPFRSTYLFAPWGVDLALHSHTALPSAAAALLGHVTSLVTATNLIVTLHLFLNLAVAYALAVSVTGDRLAGVAGGVIFGCSAYVGSHLSGHYNLIAAWVIPLVVLIAIKVFDSGRVLHQILLGVALGSLPYVDYYYAVYVAVALGVMILGRGIRTSYAARPLSAGSRRTLVVLAVLLAIDLSVLATIQLTGGTVLRFWGQALSLRGTDNPVAFAGLLVFAAAGFFWMPGVSATFDRAATRAAARVLWMPAVIAAVIAGPIFVAVFNLWRGGDYVSQHYLWRSAPAGVDLGSLLLGHPSGLLWGGLSLRSYAYFGIDAVEQAAWIGPGTWALIICGCLLRRAPVATREWTVLGLVFGVWALGPDLAVFGHRLHVLMPAVLVRFVPVAANARIPARAIIVVYLAAAMLAAIGLAALRNRGRRRLAIVLLVLVMLDSAPAPSPTYRLDRPLVFDALARQPSTGALVELPFGVRDGFGQLGGFDPRSLWYQMIHGRAIAGGFAARVPPTLLESHAGDRILGPLLRLSAGGSMSAENMPNTREAVDALLAHGFRHIILNRVMSPPDLLAYVERMSLRRIATDEERTLYELIAPDGVGPPGTSQLSGDTR